MEEEVKAIKEYMKTIDQKLKKLESLDSLQAEVRSIKDKFASIEERVPS